MKILFYIQRLEDAHMAHAMASTLQLRLEVFDFSAIAFRQAPEGNYLLNEAGEYFKQVLSETEMHRKSDIKNLNPGYIQRLESRFGLPFWQYVTQNRFLIMKRANYLHRFGTPYNREELVSHVQTRFEMIERFLDQVKPDVIVFPVDVGPSSALILERVARERKIPILVPISSKIGSYHTFIDTVFSKAQNIENRFSQLQSGIISSNHTKARKLIDTFRQGHIQPSYLKDISGDNFANKVPVRSALKKSLDIIKLRFNKGIFQEKHGEIFNVSQLQYDLDRAAGYYRRFRLRYGNHFHNVIEGEKYFLFPFHVEPELALLLYAPFQTHQSSVMQNVAQSLPWDSCLYVKEHPQAVGTKDMGFYNRVKSTANVRMIYPHVSSRALIAKSSGVITITGTAGMEAMLMNKPAITLGDVFYTFVPKLVQRAKSIEELPTLIRNLDSFEPDEGILENFVSAILDESVEVDPEGLAAKLLALSLEDKRRHPELVTYTEFLIHSIQQRLQPQDKRATPFK